MVRAVKKPLGLLTLAAATYFMVSGGPYGLENLIAKTGYGPAALIIVLVPILWSLPTALMVGELSAALPEDGGYYAWTRRALGPFWGFQEAWLSLAAAVFDMGIYPSLLVAYLAKLYPVFDDPVVSFGARAVVLASAVLVNLRGARAVGRSAEAVGLLLLAPFGVFTVIAVARPHAVVPHPPTHDWLGGIVVAMWNTMGWDNASTIAGEVSEPQRTYPRALGITLVLVVVGYLIPIGAAWWGFTADARPFALAVVGFALFGAGVMAGWWRGGRQLVSWRELIALPIYVAAKIPLYVRLFTKRQVEWVRTKRDETRD